MTTTVWIFTFGLVFLAAGIILLCVFTGKNKEDKEVKNKVNRLNTLMQVALPPVETSCLPPEGDYAPGSEGELKHALFMQALKDIQDAARELDNYLTENKYKITEEVYDNAVEEVKKAKEITPENLASTYMSCSKWCTGYQETPNTTIWFPNEYACMCNRGYGKDIISNQGGFAYCSPYTEEPEKVKDFINKIGGMDIGSHIKKPDVVQYTPFGTGGLIPDETIPKFVRNTKLIDGLKAKLVQGSFCSVVAQNGNVHAIATKGFKLPDKIYFINDRKVYHVKGGRWTELPTPSGVTWIEGLIQGGTITNEDTPSWLGVNECYSNFFEDTSP